MRWSNGLSRRGRCCSGSLAGWSPNWSLSERYGRRVKRDDPVRRTLAYLCRAPPNAQLHITALQLEFGDFFLFEKLDKFFDLFEVHAFEGLASSRSSRICMRCKMRGSP